MDPDIQLYHQERKWMGGGQEMRDKKKTNRERTAIRTRRPMWGVLLRRFKR